VVDADIAADEALEGLFGHSVALAEFGDEVVVFRLGRGWLVAAEIVDDPLGHRRFADLDVESIEPIDQHQAVLRLLSNIEAHSPRVRIVRP